MATTKTKKNTKEEVVDVKKAKFIDRKSNVSDTAVGKIDTQRIVIRASKAIVDGRQRQMAIF